MKIKPDGTFESLITQPASASNDVKERMSDFIEKHATVVNDPDGDGWVETTPEIIKILQPRGLNGAKFFCYKGAKVCEYGLKQQIIAEESMTVHDRMHPGVQPTVVSG